MYLLLLTAILIIVVCLFAIVNQSTPLQFNIKAEQIRLQNLLTTLNVSNTANIFQKYTELNKTCNYNGQIPSPKQFSNMSTTDFEILNNCGAVRVSLNLRAIQIWIQNSTNKTADHLQQTIACVNTLPLVKETFNNFDSLVTKCLTNNVTYSLPVLPMPYLTTQEINTMVINSSKPSQWVNDGTTLRPWNPEYPIMSIPSAPVPLFGTSNL